MSFEQYRFRVKNVFQFSLSISQKKVLIELIFFVVIGREIDMLWEMEITRKGTYTEDGERD